MTTGRLAIWTSKGKGGRGRERSAQAPSGLIVVGRSHAMLSWPACRFSPLSLDSASSHGLPPCMLMYTRGPACTPLCADCWRAPGGLSALSRKREGRGLTVILLIGTSDGDGGEGRVRRDLARALSEDRGPYRKEGRWTREERVRAVLAGVKVARSRKRRSLQSSHAAALSVSSLPLTSSDAWRASSSSSHRPRPPLHNPTPSPCPP